MRTQGYPVLYVAELTTIAGASTGSTVINFNNGGVVRNVSMAAVSAGGTNMPLENFTLNIYRQNRDGLMTNAVIASAFATQPGTNASSYNLAPMMGSFRVTNLDQLVVTVANLTTSTTATRISVVFWLNVED